MKPIVLASLTLLLSFTCAKAQIFTSGAFALDGSNLETVGPVVEAVNFYRFDNNAVTINGVSFTNYQAQTPDGTTTKPQTGSNFSFNANGVDGTGGGLTGASSAVADLNSEGIYQGTTFQLTNLSAGTTYALQFILDANNSDYRTLQLTDGSATSNVVTGGIPGPQYITDTFTAISTAETIGFSGNLQVSGFVAEVIPEPSTYAMLGLGLLALVSIRRFRRLSA